jgi:hypothetical protein
MEQCSCPLAVEMFPGKQKRTAITAPYLPRERKLSLVHAQKCSFLIMEQCSGPLAVEIIQETTAISAPILPRERELSLAHAQRCIFLIKEQWCGPLAVEIVPGKHCEFINYIAKRARAQSGSGAKVQFPDYGTALWSIGSRIYSRKANNFQHHSWQESESSVWRMRSVEVS